MKVASLKVIRSSICSQCNSFDSGVMGSILPFQSVKRAKVFEICCNLTRFNFDVPASKELQATVLATSFSNDSRT